MSSKAVVARPDVRAWPRRARTSPLACLPAGRRRRGEPGAVLLETALVAIVLAVMAFGALEYGLLLRQASNVADAVRSGTRAAASGSNASTADFDILMAMKDSKKGLSANITKVVIFKAGADGKPQNPACAQFVPQPGACNVYTTTDFDLPASALVNRSVSQNGWAPSARNPGVDYVGVRTEADHRFLTGFFGPGGPLQDTAVVLIEKMPAPGVGATSPALGFTNGVTDVPPYGVSTPAIQCTTCVTAGPGSGVNG